MRSNVEPGEVRFATPYLEVETQSTSSLERAIKRELAQARLADKRKKRKRAGQPDGHQARHSSSRGGTAAPA